MISRKLAFLLFLFLLIPIAGKSINKDSLQQKLAQFANLYRIPEIKLILVEGDSTYFLSNLKQYNENQILPLGLLSRTYTTFAVLKLASKGVLHLDRPVDYYLPWFELQNTQKGKLITVRNLLQQTSGFLKEHDLRAVNSDKIEDITTYCRSINLEKEPGDEFHESPINYQLLGIIVGSVTENGFQKYMTESVFLRAGLKNTYLGSDIENQSIFHGNQYFTWFRIPSPNPQTYNVQIPVSGISSSSVDVERWLRLLLNKGVLLHKDTLLDAKMFELIWRPKYSKFSMGWFVSTKYGYTHYKLSGLQQNYSNFCCVMPEKNTAFYIIGNSNSVTGIESIGNWVIRNLSAQPDIVHFTYEPWLRLLFLFWIIWNMYELLVYIRLWYQDRFPFKIRLHFTNVIRLFFSFFFILIWLYIIPNITGYSFSELQTAQPDLFLLLVINLFCGIIWTILRVFIRDKHYFDVLAWHKIQENWEKEEPKS